MTRRGRSFARTFSIKRYGSNEAAIEAALAYRNQLISEHAMVSRRESHVILRANSHSGIPGVRLHDARPPGRWVASIDLNGRSMSNSFSVKRYGYDQAFELALQARKQMLRLVVDRKTMRPPCDPALELAPEHVVTDVVVPPSVFVGAPNHSTDVPGVFRFLFRRQRPDGTWLETPTWGAEYRWPDKMVVRRTYSVTRFGEDGARQMAFDQHAAWSHSPPARLVRDGKRKKHSQSRKPICSVERKIQHARSDGRPLAYWQVIYRFPDDGQQRSATYSVARYGEEGARARADDKCLEWQSAPPAKLRIQA